MAWMVVVVMLLNLPGLTSVDRLLLVLHAPAARLLLLLLLLLWQLGAWGPELLEFLLLWLLKRAPQVQSACTGQRSVGDVKSNVQP